MVPAGLGGARAHRAQARRIADEVSRALSSPKRGPR
jgi:hypothetical protein